MFGVKVSLYGVASPDKDEITGCLVAESTSEEFCRASVLNPIIWSKKHHTVEGGALVLRDHGFTGWESVVILRAGRNETSVGSHLCDVTESIKEVSNSFFKPDIAIVRSTTCTDLPQAFELAFV